MDGGGPGKMSVFETKAVQKTRVSRYFLVVVTVIKRRVALVCYMAIGSCACRSAGSMKYARVHDGNINSQGRLPSC